MKLAFGSAVLEATLRLLLPFMLLFAAYVVVHGHYSPGGGFQGGTLFAAALILIKLARGVDAEWGPRPRHALAMACSGTALFTVIGLVSLCFGAPYLDYAALPLPLDPVDLRMAGMLGIELGVALAVTGVLLLVFEMLVAWGEEEEEA